MTKLRARFSRTSPPTAATDLTGKIALTWMVRKADMPTKLTTEIITAAVEGFEQQKLRIDAQIAELRKMLTGTPTDPAATPESPIGKRRKMSAAARKRIGDAQRNRWAESKKTSSPVAPEAPKPKRKLTAAGKKAIVEATKKRWAAFHAAKKAETSTVARKRAAKKT